MGIPALICASSNLPNAKEQASRRAKANTAMLWSDRSKEKTVVNALHAALYMVCGYVVNVGAPCMPRYDYLTTRLPRILRKRVKWPSARPRPAQTVWVNFPALINPDGLGTRLGRKGHAQPSRSYYSILYSNAFIAMTIIKGMRSACSCLCHLVSVPSIHQLDWRSDVWNASRLMRSECDAAILHELHMVRKREEWKTAANWTRAIKLQIYSQSFSSWAKVAPASIDPFPS